MSRRTFILISPLKQNVWATIQGQYVLRLRAELEKQDLFDYIKEDWDAIELALKEGCKYFEVRGSRTTSNGTKLLFRIAPVRLTKQVIPESGLHYLNMKEWR